ncbi:hypothetical protein GCM10010216_46590 [Streptomyces flaveolus]|nr:hypothetical protein GCM10010216_46590 [Streptomyces flaveolus]
MNPPRYSHQQKVAHLLRWAASWSDTRTGESMWSYSLGLGGSHALLNGWYKNEKVRNSLTMEERALLETALQRSSHARTHRKRTGCRGATGIHTEASSPQG